MNPTTNVPAVLVPPRPNLAPEPMEPASSSGWWVLVCVVILLSAGGLAIGTRRLKRKLSARRGARKTAHGLPGPDVSERVRLLWCSTAIRAELARRFGALWAARTTEEIAARPELVETYGSEQAERLIAFLQAADLAKFRDADASPSGFQGADWEAWAVAFLDAGASSIKIGK